MGESDTDKASIENPVENPVKARWSQKGWGYVVLAAAFLAAFLLDGVESSFGILMPHLVKELNADVSLASFSGGLITGTALGIGPIVSQFIERFGCRLVAFAGGAICFISIVLSTMSVNIAMFMVCYGVCSGIGVGMAYMSYITVVNLYFDKRRSFAMGIVTSGSGLGLLSMALLINFLISNYGWRGSYLIVAAIWGHLCTIALTMRPLEYSNTTQEMSISTNFTDCNHHSLKGDKSGLLSKTPGTQLDSVGSISSTGNQSSPAEDSNNIQSRTSNIDSGVLRDSDDDYFSSVLTSKSAKDHNCSYNSVATMKILPFPSTHSLVEGQDRLSRDRKVPAHLLDVPSFHQSHSDIPSNKDFFNLPSECMSSSLLSLASRTSRRVQDTPTTCQDAHETEKATEKDVINRQLHQKATYKSLLKNPVFLLFCYGAFSFQLAFSIGPMFAPSYAIDLGLTANQASFTVSIMGVFFPLQSVILVEILGIDQLPKSFGIICFCKSIACMIGPYLAGALYEMTQDYTVPFLFAGGVNILASFTQLIMARLRQPCCRQ